MKTWVFPYKKLNLKISFAIWQPFLFRLRGAKCSLPVKYICARDEQQVDPHEEVRKRQVLYQQGRGRRFSMLNPLLKHDHVAKEAHQSHQHHHQTQQPAVDKILARREFVWRRVAAMQLRRQAAVGKPGGKSGNYQCRQSETNSLIGADHSHSLSLLMYNIHAFNNTKFTVGDRTVALNIIARCSITQLPPDSETSTMLLTKAGHKTDFTHAISKYDFKFVLKCYVVCLNDNFQMQLLNGNSREAWEHSVPKSNG